ncbi:MAG TPA: SDR family NAD(P)-dependent oxidoreductase [Alphaproteobacteria bacterium]|nr:SDR family NAD(P)-dependent oxidoreductase [Alphaproteobacteria bacterium]
MGRAVEGKVAVVTGASRGIGEGIARRLGAEGATVIASARTMSGKGDFNGKPVEGSVEETVAAIRAAGGQAVGMRCDMAHPRSRAEFADRVLSEFGGVDILLNNAVGSLPGAYDQVTDAQYDHFWELAVKGPFDLIRRFGPGMVARGQGWIVNLTSRAAEHPPGPPYPDLYRSGGMLLYGAGKAALNRLTSGLAAELYGKGVAVNALAPVSLVWTPGAAASGLDKYRSSPGWQEEPVETMAEAALALATADPEKLTGRVVYSGEFLAEIGRKTHTLDGKSVLENWKPAIP